MNAKEIRELSLFAGTYRDVPDKYAEARLNKELVAQLAELNETISKMVPERSKPEPVSYYRVVEKEKYDMILHFKELSDRAVGKKGPTLTPLEYEAYRQLQSKYTDYLLELVLTTPLMPMEVPKVTTSHEYHYTDGTDHPANPNHVDCPGCKGPYESETNT